MKDNVRLPLKLLAVMLSLLWTIQATATPKPTPASTTLVKTIGKQSASQRTDKKSADKKADKSKVDKHRNKKTNGVSTKKADKNQADKSKSTKKPANQAADKKAAPKKTTKNNPKLSPKKPSKSQKTYKLGKHIPHAHLNKTAKKHGIDPMLVKAIIKVESGGRPNARSPKGAVGLMQVMPATARQYGRYNLKDPKQNITVGVRHFAGLKKRYKNTKIALAAYNAGEGNVNKYGGIPPFKETRRYVANTMATYHAFKQSV